MAVVLRGEELIFGRERPVDGADVESAAIGRHFPSTLSGMSVNGTIVSPCASSGIVHSGRPITLSPAAASPPLRIERRVLCSGIVSGRVAPLRSAIMASMSRLAALVFAMAAALSAAQADRVPAQGGDIEITPLLHASGTDRTQRQGDSRVDPWSTADLSRAKRADLIVTDDQAHHLDPRAIARLKNRARRS